MNPIVRLFICVLSIYFVISCKKDIYNNLEATDISFSVDTLKYDTIFSRLPSVTKQIKIYNKSSSSILLNKIHVLDHKSYYTLNINGESNSEFDNVMINASDSLYIFIKVNTKFHNKNKPVNITDHLVVDYSTNQKSIVLESYIQDAVILENKDITNYNFTPDRPYLIIGNVNLLKNNTLMVSDSANVYFYKNSSLNISGRLLVKGSFKRPVRFRSYRNEKMYTNIPSQWNSVNINKNTGDCVINYLICKNGINGFNITDNNFHIDIQNSIFTNFSGNCIKISDSDVSLQNVLLANSGNSCLQTTGKSNVSVMHSSIVNYWVFFSPLRSALYVDIDPNVNFKMYNSIVYGKSTNELYLKSANYNFEITNNLLKISDDKIKAYSSFLNNNIYNKKPLFVNISKLDFHLLESSPARNKGFVIDNTTSDYDLDNIFRESIIDLGVYQYVDN